MDSFNRTNLQNIKNIFEEKTGVELGVHRRRRISLKTAVLAGVILIFSLRMTGFAGSLFSGDADLALGASYEGDGIVSIHVENSSDKELSFQPQLKLMLWSTGEEIEPISEEIFFYGTTFKAHSNGTMTVDISKTYDIEALEEPLTDDYYYFVLTNNHFMFGQDWMCTIFFAEPIETAVEEPVPMAPAQADEELTAQVMEELQPYFEEYLTDIDERRARAYEYLAKCQELLRDLDGNIVMAESPFLVVDCEEPGVVFDETVPLENQLQLTGEHQYTLDSYGIPVGSEEMESALVLSAYIPRHKGETDGGAEIPLFYIFIYDVNAVEGPRDYAFVHGQLMTFRQMEQYKVYEDDRYMCYDMTALFYTDLRQHTESMLSQRSDVYFDEQVWKRVENIYDCFKRALDRRDFYYISSEGQ